LKGFKNSLHIFRLPPFLFNNFWHLTVNAEINSPVGLHDCEDVTLNAILFAHNYRIIHKRRRRIISIKITAGKLCTIPAICKRIYGSANGPPVHSRSPVLVHRQQLRHFFRSSEIPWKLNTRKRYSTLYSREHTCVYCTKRFLLSVMISVRRSIIHK
jgi:hypothetical protein